MLLLPQSGEVMALDETQVQPASWCDEDLCADPLDLVEVGEKQDAADRPVRLVGTSCSTAT
jgi:hypothetical protein